MLTIAGRGRAVPELRRLAREWLAHRRAAPAEAILDEIDRTFAGGDHVQKTLAALVLGYCKHARAAVTPDRLDGWLGHLAGWAEIDALCANVMQPEELLADWPAYGEWLSCLATDPNINKRRAALVLLTGPVRRSDDPRFAAAAFRNIRTLQAERAILIAKAVSWLLRNLSIRHRDAVVRYLGENRAALPAIAVRETETKLETGAKSGRRGAPPRRLDSGEREPRTK